LTRNPNTTPHQPLLVRTKQLLTARGWMVPLLLLGAHAAAAPIVPVPSPAIASRSIVNPSFEVPAVGTLSYPSGTNRYSTTDQAGAFYNDADVPGWNTTAGSYFDSYWNYTYTAPIEFWRRTTASPGNNFPSAAAGNQYVELNSSEKAAIYQDLCLINGESISLSAQHRARGTSTTDTTTTNTMRMFLSDPTLWTGKTFTGTPDFTSGTLSATTTAWKAQTASWTNNVATRKYRLAFEAITGTANDVTQGNFLDNIQIGLAPTVSFVATDAANGVNLSSVTEDNTYFVTLRVNGNMQTAGTFDITLGSGSTVDTNDFKVGTPVSGTGGAVRSGVTATKGAGGTITVNVPAGIYDPNAPADYITVPLDMTDYKVEATETANFTLANLTGGGSAGTNNLRLGSGVCDPLSSLNVTVNDNDVATDYGDAPDTGSGTGAGNYQTLPSDGGPGHVIVPGLSLGSVVDADDGTLQNAAATADDTTGTPNDEDGVSSFPPLPTLSGLTYTVPVTVTNTTASAAYLVGYLDFNKDGDFLDTNEQAITDCP